MSIFTAAIDEKNVHFGILLASFQQEEQNNR
jgi:hypothetical protein